MQIADNLVVGNSGGTQGGGFAITDNSETLNFVNNTVFGNSVDASAGSAGGVLIAASSSA